MLTPPSTSSSEILVKGFTVIDYNADFQHIVDYILDYHYVQQIIYLCRLSTVLDGHFVQQILKCRFSTLWTAIVFRKFYGSADFPHIGLPLCSANSLYIILCLANSIEVQTFHTLDCHYVKKIP